MSNTPQAARTAQRPRRRAFRRANQRPTDGAMSIVEHIQELRRRLIIAVIAILIGTILGYLWYGTNVGPLRSLGEILREPYCKLPSEVRFGAATGECRLLATGPFEMFLLRLKVGFIAGIVLSAPVWIGQIWGFITPGLKKNERRWAVSVSLVATLFFFFGAALAYLVLHHGLHFLLTVGDEAQITALKGSEYFSFVLILLLVFGVSFELPLFTVLLSFAGLLRYDSIKTKRRYIIVGLFVFAAFVTPADPFSMLALGCALTLMMEIAYVIIRFNDKRRDKRQAREADAPGSDIRPSGAIGPAEAVERAEPIKASQGIAGQGPADPGIGRRNSFNYAEIFDEDI